MNKLITLLIFMFCLTFLNSQTIINTPSINKYANVVALDYCKNTVDIPAGMGGQFSIGDKILLIQMKGASLIEGNTINTGKVDDYNNAGNYEINEIRSINSGANDVIVFEYEIERAYNVSGFVQIVNIPQYDDVVIQNTLTCQAWNGSFGGILTFNATSSVTLNADIDVSEKGFRGGVAESLGGALCFGLAGYTGYNCDYVLECGAPKGEGIGNRYETLELARTPNANGGGGGSDHNSGGGGGSAFDNGGRGGDMLQASCNGFGAFGGEKIEYSNTLNKLFFTGGGGAGDGGNAGGPVGSTSGGNAGGIVFITTNSISSNGNKIISNGKNVTDIAFYDGAGGGGAGGLVILDINNYTDNLSIELNGGNGGDVEDASARCPGPGGGGAAGIVWLSQNSTVANLLLTANGGVPGVNTMAPCMGDNNNAEVGEDGGFYFDFPSYETTVVFEELTLVAGSDTVICGEGVAPLWSETSSSRPFDFIWTWSTGTATANNFDFDPEFSGSYNVTALSAFEIHGQNCNEIFIVNVDIRKPNISIVASSFFGDTIKAGDPYFLNAVVSPLNPNYIYEWTPGENVDPNDERNTTATPGETEEYCLKVTDELGCSNTECVDLYVYEPSIIAPDAFSPNGDDLNDTYIPILSEDLEVISYRIYNRWGDIVYETREKIAWDGTKNGKELPLDLYIWHLKVKQTISEKLFERQGEVSIIR